MVTEFEPLLGEGRKGGGPGVGEGDSPRMTQRVSGRAGTRSRPPSSQPRARSLPDTRPLHSAKSPINRKDLKTTMLDLK